jgi:hypothetical protein
MTQLIEITIPNTFAFDHESRECLTGEVIKRTKRTTTYLCNPKELDDWKTDAEYYIHAGKDGWLDEGHQVLCRSAAAALKRIKAVLAS